MAVGGSLIGGTGAANGRIRAFGGALGPVRVTGDVVGGSAAGTDGLFESGFIGGQRIASVTIGGSLIAGTDATPGSFFHNGAIAADDDLGTVLIKGSIRGNPTSPATIVARGQGAPSGRRPGPRAEEGGGHPVGRPEHGGETGPDPQEPGPWGGEAPRPTAGGPPVHPGRGPPVPGRRSYPRLGALYELAPDSGMRPGELFALHYPDVDFEGGRVTVRQSLEELQGHFRLKKPKSPAGRRTLPVSPATVEALRAHRERMRADGRDVNTRTPPGTPWRACSWPGG